MDWGKSFHAHIILYVGFASVEKKNPARLVVPVLAAKVKRGKPAAVLDVEICLEIQQMQPVKIENDADPRYLGFAKNGDRLAETFPRRLVQSSVPMLGRIWSIAKVLIIVIKKTTYHFILMINTGALLDKLLHNLHMTLGSCSLERRVPRLIRRVRMIRIILMIRVAMRTAMFKNVNDDENSQNPGATHRSRQG